MAIERSELTNEDFLLANLHFSSTQLADSICEAMLNGLDVEKDGVSNSKAIMNKMAEIEGILILLTDHTSMIYDREEYNKIAEDTAGAIGSCLNTI